MNRETIKRRMHNGRIEQIGLGSIGIGKRLREVGDVSDLTESMSNIGLESPITVRTMLEGTVPGLQLVAGARRLEAARRLGWEVIECQVHVGMSDDEAEALEIIENLHRRDLTATERRDQAKRLLVLEAEKENAANAVFSGIGKGKAGPGRGKKGIVAKVAEQTGLSKDTVDRAKKELEAAGELPPPAKPKKSDESPTKKLPTPIKKPAKGLPIVLAGPEDTAMSEAIKEPPEEGTETECIIKFKDAEAKRIKEAWNAWITQQAIEEGVKLDPTTVDICNEALVAECYTPPLVTAAEAKAAEEFTAFFMICAKRYGRKTNETDMRSAAEALAVLGYSPPVIFVVADTPPTAPDMDDLAPAAFTAG